MKSRCPFINRDRELETLTRAFERRPLLAVIYGRRRLGKTRLIREFLEKLDGMKTIYYTASLASHQYNLRMLLRAAKQLVAELPDVTVMDLSSALSLLYRYGVKVVVLDEITFWARAAPRVVSDLQSFVDEVLPDTDMLLILLGSHVGVMENNVVGGGAPLYGRASVRLRLGMIPFKDTRHFYTSLSPEDIVRLYALVGGIPYYNCMLRGVTGIREALEILVGSPGAPLLEEPFLILRDELREPAVYNTLLSAIAQGYRTPSRMSQFTGIPLPHISKYLSVLSLLGLVDRETPLFRKKGKYRIRDPPLRTYYELIEPVRSLIELGKYNEAIDHITTRIDDVTASTWEELARNHLLGKYAGKGYTIAGRVEHRGEELDIALLDQTNKTAIVGEAKWSDITRDEAEKIRRRAMIKAAKLLKGYRVVEALVIARSFKGGKPDWVYTAEDLLLEH